jgi:adenosylcobinamide kinase/adenosylcobinamide-phosphate guanylyltransferase
VASSHLILGAARSGKSRYACALQPARARVAFVATAEARDADMTARIARHRAERPAHWRTVEAPLGLVAALERLAAEPVDAAVVDCITLWVANHLLRGETDRTILAEGDALAEFIARRRLDLTLVTNEVGAGVHPATALGVRFQDLLGAVNQRLAAACDRVTLMVAGIPVALKAPAADHGRPVEAP